MKTLLTVLCGLLLYSAVGQAAEVVRHSETASGAKGWRLLSEHIKIELNPLYRDQVLGFYLGRGFSEAVSKQISDQCVFQTVIQNVTPEAADTHVEVNLADWRIIADPGATPEPLVSKVDRINALQAAGASSAALLAYKWATFPEQQDFKLSGDYGWGMILFGEQPDGLFDLHVSWRVDGNQHEFTFEGLTCLGEAPIDQSE